MIATPKTSKATGQRHWLQSLGPRYWLQTSTTDCSITIPLTVAQVRPMNTGETPSRKAKESRRSTIEKAAKTSNQIASTRSDILFDEMQAKVDTTFSSELCENGIDASVQQAPENGKKFSSMTSLPIPDPPIYGLSMTFEAHAIYLMQSGLIARIFSDSRLAEHHRRADLLNSTMIEAPIANRPRLMTSPWYSKHILYLPIPDPTSMSHLLHYLYHGTLESLLNALQTRTITWQGVMANVDYLELQGSIQEDLWRAYRGKQ